MEEFKSLGAVAEPDPRFQHFAVRDRQSGQTRPYTLADLHAGISEITLHHDVPKPIQDHFQTARHLLLYSWFVYRFQPVAQLHALGPLEYALRERLGFCGAERPPSLGMLLREAVEQRLLVDSDFRVWPGRDASGNPTDAGWLHQLAEFLRYLRNSLAHGSDLLMPDAGRTLTVVADAVNKLYDPSRQVR